MEELKRAILILAEEIQARAMGLLPDGKSRNIVNEIKKVLKDV